MHKRLTSTIINFFSSFFFPIVELEDTMLLWLKSSGSGVGPLTRGGRRGAAVALGRRCHGEGKNPHGERVGRHGPERSGTVELIAGRGRCRGAAHHRGPRAVGPGQGDTVGLRVRDRPGGHLRDTGNTCFCI